MKKLIYLLFIFMLSVSLSNAANIKETNNNDFKIVKIEKVSEDGKTLLTTYKGRCLDGTTFTFSARNRDEAQGYVNGYCAALREME